jgi:hypothetical protein
MATVTASRTQGRAWVKLAPLLAAVGALADMVEQFQADPEAKALAGDSGVSHLLNDLETFLREQGALISEAAAAVVAG